MQCIITLTLFPDEDEILVSVSSPKTFEAFNNENIGKIKQKASGVKISSWKEGEGHIYLP